MGALNEWDRDYDINEARKHPSKRAESAHQTQALAKLRAWYESAPDRDAGGLLVLPTGAGKTFTAVRFLCRNPLSDGYKVLWLAHTHHLLEQALDSFGKRGDGADGMEVDGVEQDLIYDPCTVMKILKKRGVFDGYAVAFPPNEQGEVEVGDIDADRVVGPSKAHG